MAVIGPGNVSDYTNMYFLVHFAFNLVKISRSVVIWRTICVRVCIIIVSYDGCLR